MCFLTQSRNINNRLSVFYFGTDDLFGFARKEINGLNFYAGLRVVGFLPKVKDEKDDDNEDLFDSE